MESVNMYNDVRDNTGSASFRIIPLKKKKTAPTIRKTLILIHVIFSVFTPLVPKQDSAIKSKQVSFVQSGFENSPVVF